MYWIQYLCPRESPYWQTVTDGIIFKARREFHNPRDAVMACDLLMWQYHAVRVIDPSGNVIYSI